MKPNPTDPSAGFFCNYEHQGFTIGASASLSLLYASYIYLVHLHRARQTVPAGPNHGAAQLV
jgi:hypothetical protein